MNQFIPYFLGQAPPPFPRAVSVPEVLPRQRHRERRPDRPPPDDVRDARELLVRRLLQGEARSPWAWSSSPRATASTRTCCGPRSTRTTTRRVGSGSTLRACRPTGSSAAAARDEGSWRTTGRRTRPGPAGPARRSSWTAARSTARTAVPTSTRSASWRSGTSCSCRTRSTTTLDDRRRAPGEEHRHGIEPRAGRDRAAGRRQRTSRPTCSSRSSRSRSRSRAGATATTRGTTSR